MALLVMKDRRGFGPKRTAARVQGNPGRRCMRQATHQQGTGTLLAKATSMVREQGVGVWLSTSASHSKRPGTADMAPRLMVDRLQTKVEQSFTELLS